MKLRPWYAVEIVAWFLVICAFSMALFFLSGCGDARSPQQGGGGAGSVGFTAYLGVLGDSFTWAGAIAATLGIAARFALPIFCPALAPFAWIGSLVGVWGICATGLGLAFTFLAAHVWILALAVAASLGVVVWWHWPDLRHAWDRRMAGKRTMI